MQPLALSIGSKSEIAGRRYEDAHGGWSMAELIATLQKVGYSLNLGYWLIELETRLVYWPKGLGRPDKQETDIGYHARSMDKLIGMIDEPDQKRFRGFLADILRNDGTDRVMELAYNASWGEKIQLRLAGRQVGKGKAAKIVGFVEVITHWKEATYLARSLSFIIEALFISSDGGIIIFDSSLHVRRLNRNALDLFGISDSDESSGDYAATIEAKLPLRVKNTLIDAIENTVAVSGNFSLGGLGSPRMSWRANPWGTGIGDMSGIVMVISPKRLPRVAELAENEILSEVRREVPDKQATAQPPNIQPDESPVISAPNTATDQRHLALEWVKHPIALVSISTGEVVFANRSAREFLRISSGKRCYVENLFDLSGFNCDPIAGIEAGGYPVSLKQGARVGRMTGYDDDILFMEYSPEIHKFRPAAGSISTADVNPAIGRAVQDRNPLVLSLSTDRSNGQKITM